MKARKIYEDEILQQNHTKRFNEIKSKVFQDGSRRQVMEMLNKHEGKQISDSILDIVSKIDILDADYAALHKSIQTFWGYGIKVGTPHSTYCSYLREVWRCAFHVAASSQSVFETIESVMNRFSFKTNRKGRKNNDYWVAGYSEKYNELVTTMIYKFNYRLRGYLYHVRLSNPDWVGIKDYTTGQSIERFILQKELLLSNMDRDPFVVEYINSNTITVRGDNEQKGNQIYGLDLIEHYSKYRNILKEFSRWTIRELENPNFGKSAGIKPFALQEFLDFERASMAVSREWEWCQHCGTWVSK